MNYVGRHLNKLQSAEVSDPGPLAGRKVLIIVENLPLPFDRRVWQECLALTDAGAKVSVICPTGKGYEARYEELDGVHIYRHPLPIDASETVGYLIEYVAALWHEMRLALHISRHRGFDTIQICNPPDLMFLVAMPFKLIGKRIVFDHHDVNPELYEAKFRRRGFFWRLLLLFEKLTFKSADVVLSTNETYRRIALTRGGKASKDVFVVRSGPDLNKLVVSAPDPSWRRGREYMLGYVGVMGDQEGLDLLLNTASQLVHDMGRNVQFVLVGGGPALEDLKAMSRKLKIEEYVTFTGRVSDATLFSVLSSADVCVNPDRVNLMNDMSTMNKILEYMAFSKPIVQFDVTEGRFSAQQASLYAQPNDTADFAQKIIELLDDPIRRDKMGRYGRARVETELSWDHQVDSLISAYTRVMEKN